MGFTGPLTWGKLHGSLGQQRYEKYGQGKGEQRRRLSLAPAAVVPHPVLVTAFPPLC